jgi:hypothetical protein
MARTTITIKQGATYKLVATVLDEAGSPVNLSGATIYMQGRKVPGGDLVLNLDSESSDGAITLGPGAGQFTINIPSSQTADLPSPFRGVYDVLVVYGSERFRDLEGELRIEPGVTEVP